jgi:hypothetical protein
MTRTTTAHHPPPPPVPQTVSGVVDCVAELTWRELVATAQRNGWSTDGLQAEAPEATVGELMERRQPRPVAWACGLLPERCVRLVARRHEGGAYTSIAAPRKASGPDWAYLFIGAEGTHGRVVSASFGLVRPAERYLLVEATYGDAEGLLSAARDLARVEPFSTRRLDWGERRLVAAVPTHVGVTAALRERLRRLVGPDGRLDAMTGVPDELRFVAPADHEGPALVVSGAYDVVAAAVRAVEAEPGSKEPFVLLRYPDAHGLQAFVGVTSGEEARLEAGWVVAAEAGPALHDARLREPAGRWRFLAEPFELSR